MIDKKTIEAPFAGQLGVRQVDVGEFVSPGTTVVTLQALKPVYVEFALSQSKYPLVRKGQKVVVTVEAYPGQKFVGKVTAVAPKVKRATRTFLVQATIPNEKKRLRPGMFTEVKVYLKKTPHYVTVPRTAISYNTFGDYVYVVEKKIGKNGKPVVNRKGNPVLIANQQIVRTGPTRGNQVAILSGLDAGERVVVAGQIKLHDGSRIKINNEVLPPNDSNVDIPSGNTAETP